MNNTVSKKQLLYLKKLTGVDYNESLTKEKASELIKEALDQRRPFKERFSSTLYESKKALDKLMSMYDEFALSGDEISRVKAQYRIQHLKKALEQIEIDLGVRQ